MQYIQCKGYRIKSYSFLTITTLDTYNKQAYWYVPCLDKWITKENPDFNKYTVQSYCYCKSLRAFKKRLKKWKSHLPKGTKFLLMNKYCLFDIVGVIK